MNFIFAFLIFLCVIPVSAQEINTTYLLCEGKYENQRKNYETKLKDVLVKILKENVTISGIPGLANFEEKFKISQQNDERLLFQQIQNINYQGSINRYTGSIDLSEIDLEKLRWYQAFSGICYPTNKLF